MVNDTLVDSNLNTKEQIRNLWSDPFFRYTASVITAQQGRPIHSGVFRDPSLYAFAQSLGWPVSKGYMDNEDLEAERLFDYGILAPLPSSDAGEG